MSTQQTLPVLAAAAAAATAVPVSIGGGYKSIVRHRRVEQLIYFSRSVRADPRNLLCHTIARNVICVFACSFRYCDPMFAVVAESEECI